MDSDAIEFHPLSRPLIDVIEKVAGGAAWRGSSHPAWRGGTVWMRYLQEHEAGERWMIVATMHDIPVGYVGLLLRSLYESFRLRGIPEINDLVVSETFQRRGIATRMIALLEKHAADAGYKTIGLGVGLHPDYGAAQRLYTQLGFVPDGNGMMYNCVPVVPYSMVRADDDLCLWMEKTIKQR